VTIALTCERCVSPLEAGDLRCAVCGREAPDTGPAPDTLSIQVLRCESCGAAVSYDAAVGAPNCSFCDSVMHLEDITDPVEQTGAYLAFAVSQEEARRRVKNWLANQGFFRPADLAQRAKLESIKAIYWVAWICDARAFVTWTADSDLGAGRSAWAPHSGETPMHFDDLLISASRGLQQAEVAALFDHYPLDRFAPRPVPPEGDVPVAFETFDVQRSGARRTILHAVRRAAARRVEAHHVPGKRFRKVHASALLEALETRRVALPAWVFAYRYKGKLYRAVVCGSDAAGITGTVPFSWARLLIVIGAVLAFALLGFLIFAAVS
jgi:hypothetical protein